MHASLSQTPGQQHSNARSLFASLPLTHTFTHTLTRTLTHGHLSSQSPVAPAVAPPPVAVAAVAGLSALNSPLAEPTKAASENQEDLSFAGRALTKRAASSPAPFPAAPSRTFSCFSIWAASSARSSRALCSRCAASSLAASLQGGHGRPSARHPPQPRQGVAWPKYSLKAGTISTGRINIFLSK